MKFDLSQDSQVIKINEPQEAQKSADSIEDDTN